MSGQWRQGRKVPRNVYRGDEPIAMVATAEIAAEMVAAGNAREAVLELHAPSRPEDTYTVCACDYQDYPCATVRALGVIS